ncbi:hydroxyisourate hydrolase [Alteribacillus sp. HJP-4]|uniref:hydroxyisourate hydrolase n=1 Tax=Alteribacillus sp. HJP-4 TaxID=2775394 RepID=UPI0035CD2349
MKGLTTHILDLTHGKPAADVTIQLSRITDYGSVLLKEVITNSDGRLDNVLLTGDDAEAGEYEMLFYIGDYFYDQGTIATDPPFLDKVAVRFGLSDPNSHYHVPLLVSPWGYQVYRGS